MAEFLPLARGEVGANVMVEPSIERAEAVLLLAQDSDTARTAAEPLLRAALARFEELGVPYEAARTAELLATVVSGEQRQELLRRALEAYRRLNAVTAAALVESALSGAADHATDPAVPG